MLLSKSLYVRGENTQDEVRAEVRLEKIVSDAGIISYTVTRSVGGISRATNSDIPEISEAIQVALKMGQLLNAAGFYIQSPYRFSN